ncbi:MAG: VWA domain-containing protein [Acidimicrobiia bacterium]
MSTGPVRDIATFAEALRSRGMMVTPDQVFDMVRSFTLVDPSNRSHVYAALRALTITDPGHRLPYDEEFRRFFEGFHRSGAGAEQHSRLASTSQHKPIIESIPEQTVDDATSQSGASAIENVAARDFADLDDDELAEAKRIVSAMFWQPSDFVTRRWIPNKSGRRPDLRRTLHSAVGPEGDLMAISMKGRRLKQRPLIVIADISGSMERYADLFLVFAHAAQSKLDQVEVFTFSTHLTRITPDLAKRDSRAALSSVTRTVTDWSGGTKIGEAFADWNKSWSRRLARGGPILMVLSDGWDCGDPQLLSIEMGRLARSVHRVLWLNPLAARQDYQPATQGMKAVLPHVNHLLPAASVHDLRGVVRLLESTLSKTPIQRRPPIM